MLFPSNLTPSLSPQTPGGVSCFVRASYSSATDEEIDLALGRLATLLEK
jgi:DNA-binding transcriptional MocR family regulator